MRFFSTLIGSFYSADTYRDVRRSPGSGLAYSLLLITLITCVPIFYGVFTVNTMIFESNNGKLPIFDDIVKQVADQLPVMTLKDNRLVTKEPKIHTVNLEVTEKGKTDKSAFITIDTTGATTYTNMPTPVLITAKEVVYKDGKKNETTIKTFHELFHDRNPTIVINHAVAQEGAQQLITYTHNNLPTFYIVIAMFCWVFFIFGCYVLRLCMLVVLALGGLLLGQCLNTPVTFDTSMRLAAVSNTPVTFIYVAAMLFLPGSFGTLWLILCGLIMLGAALLVTRDTPLAETV